MTFKSFTIFSSVSVRLSMLLFVFFVYLIPEISNKDEYITWSVH